MKGYELFQSIIIKKDGRGFDTTMTIAENLLRNGEIVLLRPIYDMLLERIIMYQIWTEKMKE